MPVSKWNGDAFMRKAEAAVRQGLDRAGVMLQGEVQDALENLMKGRTTLVIAHRLSTIRNADRIIVLVNGEIREEGTHDDLLACQGEYCRLYNMQFKENGRAGEAQAGK